MYPDLFFNSSVRFSLSSSSARTGIIDKISVKFNDTNNFRPAENKTS